jgi:4-carboxymuconolactone decarboxylase
MERIANIVIEARHLESYRAALKEEIEASVSLEPGVLTLYAVSAREDPTRFTILEIYADQAAYEAHLKTPHFLKYKSVTQGMVKSLELIDAVALVPDMKIK